MQVSFRYNFNMIRTIEEFSMNAWPAMQTLLYDGWVLRFAEGYTKRANSVNPIYASELDLDEKIGVCEAHFHERGLPTVFKMTVACTPEDLDAQLEARGYHVDSPTSVQVYSVQLLDLRAGEHQTPENIQLTSEDSDAWHESFARMNNVGGGHRATHEHILRAIQPDKCYASLSLEGEMVACGLGVLQSGNLGIFDIVIDPGHRGQGYGTRLMEALLAWGQEQGAHGTYLQVMLNNKPALRLYEKLGYQEKYRYWYRVKE